MSPIIAPSTLPGPASAGGGASIASTRYPSGSRNTIASTVPRERIETRTGAPERVTTGAPSFANRRDDRVEIAHEDLHVRCAGIHDVRLRGAAFDVRKLRELEVEPAPRNLQHRDAQRHAGRVRQQRNAWVLERLHFARDAEHLGVERERRHDVACRVDCVHEADGRRGSAGRAPALERRSSRRSPSSTA